MVIFQYKLYIFVWIYHGCLTNTVYAMDPNNNVIKRLWCINKNYLSVFQREHQGPTCNSAAKEHYNRGMIPRDRLNYLELIYRLHWHLGTFAIIVEKCAPTDQI